jgi:L-alanine-DL-glutamate epimerase-like enolase superfamily enzyme
MRFRDGAVDMPMGPGMGIDPDDKKIAKYKVQQS